ncbi:Phospholipid-transporting ATPase 10 [Capsicum chinense]|nr:Phospholipid-transporting ATPase 10 [Capsicum chinense]
MMKPKAKAKAEVEEYQEPPENVKLFVGNLPYDVDRHKRKLYVIFGVLGNGYLLYKLYEGHRRQLSDLERELADEKRNEELIGSQVQVNILGRHLYIDTARGLGSSIQLDIEANNRKVNVYTDNNTSQETLRVGDLIKVFKDEYFPADLLLLSSSYEDGICYVETSNLDGVTNLKVKHALNITSSLNDDSSFQNCKAVVKCEDPNEDLYTFIGTLYYDKQQNPLSVQQLLLQGLKLRNTDYVYGVIIFTGHDTKVMQNSTDPPSKKSGIEKRIDRIIYVLFGTVITIAFIGSIFFRIETKNDISSDMEMYYEETDKPARARISYLNEELGQVDTILSDKTDTLTCNSMEFVKCSIAGDAYGRVVIELIYKKWKTHIGNFESLRILKNQCSLLNSCFCKSQSRVLLCSTGVKSMINEKGDIETHLNKTDSNNIHRKFSLRLKSRLRLLSRRLKRVSVKSMLNDFGKFLRKNTRKVTLSTSISVVLGLCCLFLRLTATPSPKVVPYSDLITSLQGGSVTKVQFEEGTRRIYYNTNLLSLKNAQTGEDSSVVPAESTSIVEESKDIDSNKGGKNVFSKISKAHGSTPLWQFSTRKIDHDEGYLLSLMREKGTAYGSAPQSALMSLRSLLITMLSLWIPLTPIMWLLYRQLSAANSPARKRRPSNQVVGFNDVEGVDAAKVELMEAGGNPPCQPDLLMNIGKPSRKTNRNIREFQIA